jgi:cyclopropane fatty-acyl-phospholipid synthase-like methyltransferase
MDAKPFAPACERNRDPILAVLRTQFADRRNVLEVGSGTGQHAVYFAAAMPWLSWQCADLPTQLPGIRQWLDEAGLPNTPAPLALDVGGPWPTGPYDAVFSANILHIVGWPEVEAFFAGVGQVLGAGGVLVVYGPFNAGGNYTSASNREFDAWLKARDPRSGIRDVEAVQALAARAGLHAVDDVAMPANNRCLVWRRG